MRRTLSSVAIAATVVMIAAGCATPSDKSTATSTVTPAINSAAETPTTQQSTATEEPSETTTSEATTTPAAKTVLMPNVVCMNLQAAQDRIQDAGVFFSRSKDASGQGRSQLIDSNWIVVEQTPSAGSEVGEGEAVLSAVKIGEPNNC